MSIFYKVTEGTKARTKNQLSNKARAIRNRGYMARVIKNADGTYDLYTELGLLKSAKMSVKGRDRRKF